tara:strand:- start:787 stop:1221 length:435 start_codon:yes stop_codon:yes gene_type:complete
MKRVIVLLLVSLSFISCNEIIKELKPEKENNFEEIEYLKDRQQVYIEIAKFIRNDIENISISNGYSYENGDEAIGFIDVKVKNPDASISNDAIAEDLSRAIFNILENEIINLNEFEKVNIKFYTLTKNDQLTIRKETQITLKVN